ncbi:MAG TPA: radical SAM protein [Methylomirabilota bacterium]|nr:radical SAM protein [Methylomirabilota bacterium]
MAGGGELLRRALRVPGRLVGALARRTGSASPALPERPGEIPVLVLFPHGGCNCRCVMCDIWRAGGDGCELAEAELAPHLDALRRLGVRRLALSGGEPLLHPGLWRLCAVLEPLGLDISLLTTGLLLEEQAADVVRWCDEVIVSLDGPSEIHDAVRRVPGAFDRMAAGVAALRRLDGGFRITARSVVQKRNFRCLGATVEAAAGIGLDGISFLAVDTTTEAFNRAGGHGDGRTAEVGLDRDEAAELATIVEEVIRDHASRFSAGFVAESPAKLRGLARHFASVNGDLAPEPRHCNAPWVSAVVEADGTVRPCFFHRPLGTLADGPLDTVLLGEAAVAFRRGLDVRRDPICRHCVCTLWLDPEGGAQQPDGGRDRPGSPPR